MFTHSPIDMTEQKIWQISELNQSVKSLLSETYGTLWLEGEISNFSQPRSGHWYFSLKDETAAIRGAMFRFANQSVAFQPEEGMKVLVKVNLSLYVPRGDFQIVVERMVPSGDGSRRLQFEALKKSLADKGYFDPANRKPLPLYPQTIGIVTSPTGAALQDMLKVLKRRYPLALIQLYPTLVQGVNAAPAIAQAIELADRHGAAEVLIVARGGGSLEDLWAFNEAPVAEAIYQCKCPVITGIGHETDTTIADFVADHRAPTPSAAAEEVSPDQKQLHLWLQEMNTQLNQKMRQTINALQQRLDFYEKRLVHPRMRISHAQSQLAHLSQRLMVTMGRIINDKRQALAQHARSLDAMSPLQVLGRGYAILRDKQQHVIKSSQQLTAGQNVEVILAEGKVDATVQSIN